MPVLPGSRINPRSRADIDDALPRGGLSNSGQSPLCLVKEDSLVSGRFGVLVVGL